ncbi:TAXI family TRAP transporter solute-binding subunit [Pelagibius sp.]|uniref:TAXI family TRAP transporter solute-binding subunit n=1 Tax=Pelagibius sp. TaxID=1931238 RepID=UPI003BB1AE89
MSYSPTLDSISRAAAAAIALLAGVTAGSVAVDAKERYTFLTSAPGGSWYPMAAGVVEILNEKMEDVTWSLEGGAGFINNTTLAQGNIECAWVSTDGMHLARAGEPPFESAQDQSAFRGVVMLPPSESHWVVLADSGIESIGDLKGKRVAIGERGSSANARGLLMLSLYGIGPDDIRTEYIAEKQATKALTDGRIDAFIEFISHPAPPVLELSNVQEIRLLELEPEKVEMLRGRYPYFVPVSIPAGTYPGVGGETVGFGIPGSWMCLDRVPEDVVYQMVKFTFENKARLIAVHPAFNKLNINLAKELEQATGHSIHPGAERYYREIGLIK